MIEKIGKKREGCHAKLVFQAQTPQTYYCVKNKHASNVHRTAPVVLQLPTGLIARVEHGVEWEEFLP